MRDRACLAPVIEYRTTACIAASLRAVAHVMRSYSAGGGK